MSYSEEADATAGSGSSLRLQILGPLRVWRDQVELDTGPRQQRCLLALLLAREGQPISKAGLIEQIWGADAPPSAVNVIQKYVGALRRLLEPGLQLRSEGSYLLRSGTGYRFTADARTLDLVAFRRRVSAARASRAAGREAEALDHYVAALGLWRGSAGDGVADSVTASTFAAIDGEFFDAVVAAADLAVRFRRASQVLAPLRLAVRMNPLGEPTHAGLITALAAAGHQAEALAAYQTIRRRLADEFGIDPGPELREAQRRVLSQAVPADEPAAPLPPARPAQLPPDLPMFAGRTEELAVLHRLTGELGDERRTSPMVVALDGMGGVGKSTLAAHFARRVADQFTDGQLYLDLQGDQDATESLSAGDALRSLLYALGLSASSVPDTYGAQLGIYRSLTAGKRLLLLLDNVRDAAQVRPLLPASAGCLVLVTSRRPLMGLAALDGAYLLRVDVPDLPAARALLERRTAGRLGPSAGTDEIIELCGRLPLALAVLAARLMARPGLSPATVMAELTDGADRLGVFAGNAGLCDPRTAFSWSYRQLSPAAARLFRLMSLTLNPGLTAEACVSLSGRDPHDTRAALAELAEAALVNEGDGGWFSSHVLVRTYAEELLHATETPAEREAAVHRLLQHYLHSSFNAQVQLKPHRTPIAPPPPLSGVVAERPATYEEAIAWLADHRLTLAEAVRLGHGIVPWQLALTTQQYLEWAGHFQDWEDIMRAALRAARSGGDVIGTAHALRSLAGARFNLGAYDESIALLGETLPIYVENGMVLEQGLVHSNLRSVHNAAGRHGLALEHAERAAELYRRAGDSQTEIVGLWGIGQALARLGRHAPSNDVLERALELSRQVGRLHVECEIRNDIAANLVALGRTVEAADHYRLAAATAAEIAPGRYHFKALTNLTELLLGQNDSAGAREAFLGARTVLRSMQGGGTEQMRATLATLAESFPVRVQSPRIY
jgi:DNA-binding SARP family transcriptional activator